MKRRVLIADDSSTMRQILRRLLEHHGFEVVGVAENGTETVERYQELKPDVVTLDMVMPMQNGLETLKQIKQLAPKATVVMVSSVAAQDSISACAQAGAPHYILKPFNEENVMTVLRTALGPADQSE